MDTFYKLIRDEDILVKIKKKSDLSFWEYHFFGLIGLLFNNSYDFFIITNKRILILVKNENTKNVEYHSFDKISFNPINDTLTFLTKTNQKQTISLKKIRLSYEEIQYLKSAINKTE